MASRYRLRSTFIAVLIAELVVFFSSRRGHTRWPRDWSSDVCSSDLHDELNQRLRIVGIEQEGNPCSDRGTFSGFQQWCAATGDWNAVGGQQALEVCGLAVSEIGRASCRERV